MGRPLAAASSVSAASAAAVALAALLGGCLGGGPGGPSASTGPSSTGPPPAFDGDAALEAVRGLVEAADGAPRFRVPGTPGHREAAEWLAGQLAAPGWTVAAQDFTGEQYLALDKGAVAQYADSEAHCSAADRERLRGLAFRNLVATRAGPGDRALVLGAHWDSKAEASADPDPAKRSSPVLGANDGASGVGVLLRLQRELAGADLPFSVQVVLFDGEDGFEDCHPLAGSLWFVHGLAEGAVDRMLLLDMVGDPDARFVRDATSERCDPALVDLLHGKAPRHGLAANFPGTRASVHDDHVPFAEAGIPATDLVDLGRGFPPYWHTTGDTLDKLDAGMLGRVGALLLDVLQDPGFTEPWPGPCR